MNLALYYLDTSALVKLYVREPGTERLVELADNPTDNRLCVLAITPVEVRSAVRRRERAGDLDPKDAEQILDRLQKHMETRFVQQALNEIVLNGALEMIDRYALRAFDAVQLSGCLTLKTVEAESPTFVCSDQQLLAAARSELLAVLDPCAGY